MRLPQESHPISVRLRRAVCCSLPLLLAVALLAADPAPAAAQFDTQALIGSSVDRVGPQHRDVDKAIESFLKRDIKSSRTSLEAALKKDPKLPPVDVLLARMFLLAQQGPQARAALEQAVIKSPTDPEPLLIFGEQAFGAGRITEAEQLFLKAETLLGQFKGSPKRKENFTVRTFAGLASVAERRSDWTAAAQHLKRWEKQDPESAAAQVRLGRALFQLEQEKDAYTTLLKAIKLDATLPSADVTIGRLYEDRGDREDARRFMDRAKADPKANLKTRLGVIRWMVDTGQAAAAKPLLQKILQEDSDSIDGLLFSGVVARMTGDDKSATTFFEKAHLLAPTNFDAANQLALLLVDKNDEAERNRALAYAQLNAQLHNKNSEAGVALGWIYYQMGRAREAEQLLNASLKGSGLSADSSYFVAKIFYDRGNSDTAKQLLNSALKSKRVFLHREEALALMAKINR